jgi:hypothetical protein
MKIGLYILTSCFMHMNRHTDGQSNLKGAKQACEHAYNLPRWEGSQWHYVLPKFKKIYISVYNIEVCS